MPLNIGYAEQIIHQGAKSRQGTCVPEYFDAVKGIGQRALSAIDQIKNNVDFFASECLNIVRKAADWGVESAVDNDKRKEKFLEKVSQNKGRDFLRHVLEVYENEEDTSAPTGFNGAAIASGDYIQRIERDVFLSDVSIAYSARFGAPSYTALLLDSLNSIAHTMEQDLLRNERENNYVTDETALILKKPGKICHTVGLLTKYAPHHPKI